MAKIKNNQLENVGGGVPEPTADGRFVRKKDGAVFSWEEEGVGSIKTLKVHLTKEQVKTLGSSPVDAIANPGVGKIINIIKVFARLNWNSVPFDNNALIVARDGGNTQAALYGYLNNAFNNYRSFDISTGNNNSMLSNEGIKITGTDSVSTGDSAVDVYITYQVITL